jgi:alkanesulfonate monooxygenase SsuD/methylene tetrahydromethanopterin reductase-like flavin-dependent oxidoreductase (luciferase family)
VHRAINLPNDGPPTLLVELALRAEANGWDGVFFWDHIRFFPTVPVALADPWVLLGAVAQATSTVRLGTLVTPVARRRPQKLLKELVTLDHLSGGRAVLGVGLGAPDKEDFGDFGDEVDPRTRAELLDESLTILDGFMRGGAFSHPGPRLPIAETVLAPVPHQRPRVPIWVAGIWPARRPFRRAARWDGIVPLVASATGVGLCRPDDVRTIVDFVATERDHLDGFEVVVTRHPDHAVGDYEGSGATWLLESADPYPGWHESFARTIEAAP